MSTFLSLEQQQHKIDVTFIENALVDILLKTSDEKLKLFGMQKGIMQLVDKETQLNILKKLSNIPVEIELGGSASNVARGIAILGGSASYSSVIGHDEYGEKFSKRLKELNILNRLQVVNSDATGTCLVIVTLDGERTMNTHLGACRKYQKEFIPFDDIRASKIFFSTGYMLDTQEQIDSLHAAMDFALLNNVKIAFDVADAFVIQRHGVQTILDLFSKTHIVFANSAEAEMLFGCHGLNAAKELAKYVEIGMIKDGANGSFLCYQEKITHIPTNKVTVVDTTGAGDMYAAGFLYGLCRNYSLELSCQIGSLLASDTVTHMGVRLSAGIENTCRRIRAFDWKE